MEARTLVYGDIGWTMNHVRHGWQMRRKAWPDKTYIELDRSQDPPVTTIHNLVANDGTITDTATYAATPADLLAGDWAMVNPTQPGEYGVA